MTPMQQQYHKLKAEHKDTILLFRLGDFYEVFYEDAEILSKVLGITLTARGKGENRTPMAGIPYHALPNYMPKMVDAGLRVAIAEQTEAPTPGKIVERKVVRIITPGTVIDQNSLDSSKNNYISCVYINDKPKVYKYIVTFCDLTTGELKVFRTNNLTEIKNELNKFNPAEIITQQDQIKVFSEAGIMAEGVKDQYFILDLCREKLYKQFEVKTLKGFGIEDSDSGVIISAGSLVKYLIECQKGEIEHIKSLKIYDYRDFMQLDSETIRNLELLYPMNGGDSKTTLYGILNKCQNPIGQRKLRQWILTPLINNNKLQDRLNSVKFFYDNRIITSDLRDLLKSISDIERIVGRIGVRAANPKDLMILALSLDLFLDTCKLLESNSVPESIHSKVSQVEKDKITEVLDLISRSIDEDPSVIISQGNVIKTGFDSRVDELRKLRSNSKQILAEIQSRECEKTKIPSLKISFNNVFGYYIEVTKTHIDKVPAEYIRKQTLANAERYITEELKELETKILSAEDKLIVLETELFNQIRDNVSKYSRTILEVADIIGELDVLSNFAEISREYRYVFPEIVRGNNVLEIENGRHPVVERLVENFTPNSSNFNEKEILNLITGPNMSGKSTYIRQVALIVLMAQIGCFVPADLCKLSLKDRIFTRVGAGDNLSKGESTFMVEMAETANILNNAKENSLIILDEVGRGTSTYDGVAIAWSIVEYIQENIKASTLFATHYHELTELEGKYSSIKNYNVKVVEDNNKKILFTHKIVSGSANKSYGVYVAEIAGVPKQVVQRANEILDKFEGNSTSTTESVSSKTSKVTNSTPKTPKKIHPEQLGLM